MFIYKTTNDINGKIYIGKACSKNTMKDSYLGSGVALKKAMKKYGRANFKREIIEFCKTSDEAKELEKLYVSIYKEIYKGRFYNIADGGGGRGSFRHDFKTKLGISKSLMGRVLSEEHVRNMSESLKGRQSWNKGMKMSEEFKKICSMSHVDKPLKASHRRAISDGQKGRVFSKETRDKISVSKMGRVIPEETKRKISESLKAKYCMKKSNEQKDLLI
jgi:group I intron endonuclease